ncbi:MAG: protein kinase [Chloroflexi bacterium]|nr:protein kinase [Chloroflexota bacterium]
MSTWSGKALGNVLIGDLIARGGMAEVYYGVHSTLSRKVAVKIMRDHVEEDPDSRARFAREARVVAGLDHPNIIQIFDYDLMDGRPCIVMELVPGLSLGNYLKGLEKRGEKLPHRTIASLMKSIASAVDYAHERGIVHRDIKPANILLRSKHGEIDADASLPEDVEPVLTDFGLVRLLDSTTQTSTGTVSGTPSYMSPEQARGDRVDHRTDIYSLGVVLYEMVAGVVPFDAESSFGVLMKHLNEPPPPIAGISADMQAVINRALAKEPNHRFDSAGEFINEFIAVLEGRKVSEKTEAVNIILNTPPAPPQTAASLRLPLIVGGVVTLAAIVLFGIWMMRPTQSIAPQPDPNQPIGRATFIDFNDVMDKSIINIGGLPLPQAGTHLEVWFLGHGGESRVNAGAVIFDGGNGNLSFTNPGGENFLSQFDQVIVTLEPNDDPDPNEPGAEIVASSVFPPEALIHVRHVLVSIAITPKGDALIQGLWYTADSVDTSVQQLDKAFDEGDEETLRLKTEEIINQLAGSENLEFYKDWNEDGEIVDPSDGFGLLLNGETGNGQEQGYIPQTGSHARLAAEALDAAPHIAQNGESLIVCLDNMNDWSKQLLELALQLQNMPLEPGMESTIAEMQVLSSHLLYGEDANGNGRIEPIPGEGGADTAYEYAYHMSDMPLFPGPLGRPPQQNTAP